MTQNYSNFVTPPDFVKEDNPSILIVDADWVDIETVALWCKTAPANLNIYIYSDIMLDEVWLAQSINRVGTIIVNMQSSAVDHIKKDLIKGPNTWYYGDMNFLGNDRKLQKPIDWFIKHYG
jgi:hypothetical protein